MNKTELIEAIAEKTGFTKKNAEVALNAFIAVFRTSSANSFFISAGIVSLDSEFLYFASNV